MTFNLCFFFVFFFVLFVCLFVCLFVFLQFLLIFYTLIIRRIHLNQISINLIFGGFKQVGWEVILIVRRGLMLFNIPFLFIGLQPPYVTERFFSKTMAILPRGQFV